MGTWGGMNEKFLLTQNLYSFLDYEPFFLLGGLIFIAWTFYHLFLREVSEDRHRSIRDHFKNLVRHFVFLGVLFVAFSVLFQSRDQFPVLNRALPYLGLLTYFSGAILFVRTCRLLVLQYMFLTSMQHGVPLLLVNIFSLVLSFTIGFWSISKLFNVEVTPLLATSAGFSLVLGLALQDTMGNLFAGISLQLDKNFAIGDWLEVTQGPQKTVGQVKEITWRSTVLVGLYDEIIAIPNKVLAQAHISNFSPSNTPIVRSQSFRLRFEADIENAKTILEKAILDVEDILKFPTPLAYVSEVNENWVNIKLIYYIKSFGRQYLAGGSVLEAGMSALRRNNIELARQHVEINSISPE